MHQLKERIAYLKGLSEGLNVSQNSPEGRVIDAILDVLDEMVVVMERLDRTYDQLENYVSEVDQDLSDLEEEFYDDYDEEYNVSLDEGEEQDPDQWDTIECTEMVCPNCSETIYVDKDVFTDEDVVEVLCPECHETVLVNDQSPAVSGTDTL